MIHPGARLHESADIEDDVHIGDGTAIWHRAQIRTGAHLGSDCVVGRDAFIDIGVTIGDRVKIQNGALIYHGVTIGDGVFIGPGAILTNDRYPRALSPAGEVARTEDWTVVPTTLDAGCSIGAGAVVVAGCDVGPFAMVGAGAVVTRPVPGHALVAGNPARVIGWVCACGARLTDADGRPALTEHRGDEAAPALECPRCGRRYLAKEGSLVAAT